MKRLRALLALTVSTGIVLGCGGGASDSTSTPDPASEPTAQVDLPESAIAQIKALVEEKAARTPAQKKISSQLLYAKAGKFAAPKAGMQKSGGSTPGTITEIQSLMQLDAEGRVLVDIKGDLGGGLVRQIETANGKVVVTSEAHRAVRAWVPFASLEPLASQMIVQAIRPAFQARTNRADSPRAVKARRITHAERVANVQSYLKQLSANSLRGPTGGATNAGSVTSEGSLAHAADRARQFYGVDGTGVRIGVLSDSDDFKEQSIASGDLPADTVTVPGQDGRPGSGEGTAMMEIVHDVAPGAQIFFATAFTSPESFADNIRRLRFEFGCDVIVDDVIYFFESPYQDDIIAQAVTDVSQDGALYFSSAGNQGNWSDGTSGTWEGDFRPAGTLATLPAGYTVHDFDHGPRVISNRIELDGGPLILHWSDPGTLDLPQSSNDYDLFVLDENLRNVLVAATDIQDGDDLPFEFLGFLIPPNLRVVVARNPGAQTRAIRIVHFGGELGLSTEGGNYGHSAEAHAVAVAAVDAAEAIDGEFVGGPTTPIELFSTDGNRRIFYKPNGTRMRGGVTFASGGGEFRPKPELSAADGVVTTLPPFSGLNPFFGTSAAAPHAAAIAALLIQAVPGNNAWRNRNAMIDGALDIEGWGHDRDSGAGIVMAMTALEEAGAKPVAFLELGTVTATPSSGTAIVPGGGGSLSVELVNNGGASATAVSGTLSSSTAGVTVTQGVSGYPNLAPAASGVNAAPFVFAVDPSVPCGTKLAFTLSASFTGRGTSPTVLGFPVQTGQASAPVTFSYTGPPVPIPDDDPAGVDVPVAIAGIGQLAQMQFSIDGTTCTSAIGATTVGVNHTWVGDLIFTLRSPSSSAVQVIRQAGGALNSGNNFCQTVLVDGAPNSIQNVTSAQAPFTGTFSPANPQAAFVGEIADGNWVLNVSDNAFIDTGSIRAFSLRASGFTCDAP